MNINGESLFPSTVPVRLLHLCIWFVYLTLGLLFGNEIGYKHGYKEVHPTVFERMECSDYGKLINCHWTQDSTGVNK